MWEFPSEVVRPGETPIQTLKRAFRQKVGMGVEVGEELAEIRHSYTRYRVTLRVFAVHRRSGRAQALEVAAVRWTRPGEFDALALSSANRRLADVLRDKG